MNCHGNRLLAHTVTHCHSLSLTVTHCHSLSLSVTHCHYLSLFVTICHSLSLTVTHCHSLSLTVSLPHSWFDSVHRWYRLVFGQKHNSDIDRKNRVLAISLSKAIVHDPIHDAKRAILGGHLFFAGKRKQRGTEYRKSSTQPESSQTIQSPHEILPKSTNVSLNQALSSAMEKIFITPEQQMIVVLVSYPFIGFVLDSHDWF